jgi:hypothetical protein
VVCSSSSSSPVEEEELEVADPEEEAANFDLEAS